MLTLHPSFSVGTTFDSLDHGPMVPVESKDESGTNRPMTFPGVSCYFVSI
jgi:hypothetical protein